MDPSFWIKRWQDNDVGFHAADVQPALAKHWATLGVAKGSTVFVPLAGKSLDMLWLAEQGYRLIASELSEIAVDQFFAERGLKPSVKAHDAFIIKSSGVYEMWCGDFFALDASHFRGVAAAYDRAALVAMPPEMQPRYAAKLADLIPAHVPVLLIGLDYDPREMKGPPFATPQTAVRNLFTQTFSVDVLGVRDGLAKNEHLKKKGVTWLEEATYMLRRRA